MARKQAEKKIVKLVLLQEGIYHMKRRSITIECPLSIHGAGQDRTIIKGGGFKIEGTKEIGKRVAVSGVTVSGTKWNGLVGENGLDFVCKEMTFTQCGRCGVVAENTTGRLIDCVVTQCGRSGIFCSENALI